MNIACYILMLCIKIIQSAKFSQCPKLKLECLKQHLTIEPDQCESDANIQLDFLNGLGDNYDPTGLIPVDSYFLWAKVKEESKTPNSEVIPEELKDISPYTISNRQYGQILTEIGNLKPWKVSDDCTAWYPVGERQDQIQKSAGVWISLSKLFKDIDWKDKLVLFGVTRPSPLTEAFSDKTTPIRFVIQNQILEHNFVAVLRWLKKLKEISDATKVQVNDLEDKRVEYETKVVRQEKELKTANQQEQAQDQKISDLENKLSEDSLAKLVSQSDWIQYFNDTLKNINFDVDGVKGKQSQLEESILKTVNNENIEEELELIKRKQTELEQKIVSIESEKQAIENPELQTRSDNETNAHGEEEFLNSDIDLEKEADNFEVGSGHNIHEDTKIESGNRTLKKRNISIVSQTKKLAESVKDILTVIKNVNNIWDAIKEQKQTGLRFSVRLEDLEKIRNTTEKLIKLGQDCKSCHIFSNYILITTGIAAVLYGALVIFAAVWWCKDNKDYPPTDEQSETTQPRYNPSAPTVSSIEDSQELIPLRPLPPPPTETRQFRVQKLKKQTKRL